MRLTSRLTGLVVLCATAVVPVRAYALCAPSARGIFPASAVTGTSVSATVPGDNLAGAAVTVLGDPGLTAGVQSSNALEATLQLDVAADAAPGERILVLETPGGTTGVSFTVNPIGGPVLATVSPSLLATRGVPLAVTVTGTGLAGIGPSSLTVSGTGLTVTDAIPGPDGLGLSLVFAVDVAADLGTHAVTVTTPLGGAVLQVYVQPPPPQVTGVSPAAGEVGSVVPVTLTGTHLAGAVLVVTGSGITVGDVATPDDATLTATLTIDAGVSPSSEPRLLVVTGESGQTTVEFFVVAAGGPTVTGVTPGAGAPGTTVSVTLHGLHFTGATVSEASADLTLQNPVAVDDETITVDVVIAPGAATDVDQTLTVTAGMASDDVAFRVIPPGTPFIGAVRPPFGNRGSTITVFIDGVNLSSLLPGTGIDLSGPKITETNAAAVDDRTARATLDIDPTANVGFRDVTVATAEGSFMRSGAFRVNVPGQVPSITDVSPTVVQPGTTTPVTVTGSNFAGGAVLVTGPGATITNVAVDPGGTLIGFDLTLAADAPAESRAVIVVTENGIARCGIASDPSPAPLVAAKLVKTGALFTVAGTGFRLFVLELSLNDRFASGAGTVAIPDADGTITLARADTVRVERAFRALHRGFVRVRAVTPTNRLAVSAPQAIRR
jgi:hypothetical protein